MSRRFRRGGWMWQMDFGWATVGLGLVVDFKFGLFELWLGPLGLSGWRIKR